MKKLLIILLFIPACKKSSNSNASNNAIVDTLPSNYISAMLNGKQISGSATVSRSIDFIKSFIHKKTLLLFAAVIIPLYSCKKSSPAPTCYVAACSYQINPHQFSYHNDTICNEQDAQNNAQSLEILGWQCTVTQE